MGFLSSAAIALGGATAAWGVVPVERLTQFSTVMFDPNGDIGEFINVAGNSQEFFITDPLQGDDFGAIKAQALLTRGVLVQRDNFPSPGSAGEAGATGFRDNPAVIANERVPTGFNIGRVFAAYNPDAYAGEGAYFLAMDISAPAELDPLNGSQPVAFDVDGDGSTAVVTKTDTVSEVPTDEDVYRFIIDTNNDGINDIRISIGERAGNEPFGSVEIGTTNILNLQGQSIPVVRWVFVECLAGILCPPGDPIAHARLFLDANNDNDITAADVGVGADVEIVVRRVNFLPHGTENPTNSEIDQIPTAEPACVRFTYIADSFDDEPLGGGAEDLVVLQAGFPVPDVEVIKEVRCADEPGAVFGTQTNATGGSDVEFRITIQNWGNVDLDVVLTDLLTSTLPATASVVAGSCAVTTNPGAPFNGAAFCAAFEAAMADGIATNLAVGVLEAGDDCAVGLGEQVVFTYRVRTGPATFNTALCDQGTDITNAVSVTGTITSPFDPILLPNFETNADDEEEDCNDAGCCAGIPACVTQEICDGLICVTVGCPVQPCVPNDGNGDVRDEFIVSVSDDANSIDTRREVEVVDDDNVATVELECRNITFIKEVRRQGTPSFNTGTNGLNLPGDAGSYPLNVEFRYTITNAGENSEAFVLTDASLCSDVAAAADVDTVAGQCPLCDIPTPGELSGTVNAGASFQSTCVVRFNSLAGATAFMGLDDARTTCRAVVGVDPDPLCYRNCAHVETEVGTPQTPICDAGAEFDSFATTCVVRECTLDVVKTVQCLDSCAAGNPVGPETDNLTASPGGCAQFKVVVTNTGPIPIPLLCLTDIMDCTWTVSALDADISGDDVTADLVAAGFAPNSGRECLTFPSHPGGLGVGEVLTLTFRVQIPAAFPVLGDPTDCTNSIDADGYRSTSSDTTLPPDAECTGQDNVSIDVQVPRIDCGKTVAVDLGANGTIDIPATTSANITNVQFPIRLTYTLSARNTGELPIANAQICDDHLVADAVAAGATVGPCDLCNAACDGTADNCVTIGLLPVGGPVVVRTCQITINDLATFEAFAGRDDIDGRNDCYTNEMRSSGSVTPSCAPPGTPTTVSSGNCTATVCIAVVPECPITKAKFDIWNQNERRFSGTERCITSWDQRLLSAYTPNSIANHFGRRSLQTDKGKARIDGMASGVVCGDESISAPLLGVAAKILTFGPENYETAGLSLVGSGHEAGVIKYDLPFDVGSATVGPPAPDTETRSGITTKGSLIVYPKVEIKWDSSFNLIQDTFLDISNDYPDYVTIQFYFVNGDTPTAPVLAPNGEIIERAHPGCNAVDVETVLTPDQPMHWSALTGDGGSELFPAGFSPFTILDPGFPPGRPDTDPRNPGGRVLRGYVLAWAVNTAAEEIRWNHLAGDAIIINYRDSSAWEYNTWNFPAVAGVENGDLLLPPLAQLSLDGLEYAFAPATLLMDFYASGTILSPYPGGPGALVDTDLTLWIVNKDLRRP